MLSDYTKKVLSDEQRVKKMNEEMLLREGKVKEIEEEKIKKYRFKFVRVKLCTRTPGGESND